MCEWQRIYPFFRKTANTFDAHSNGMTVGHSIYILTVPKTYDMNHSEPWINQNYILKGIHSSRNLHTTTFEIPVLVPWAVLARQLDTIVHYLNRFAQMIMLYHGGKGCASTCWFFSAAMKLSVFLGGSSPSDSGSGEWARREQLRVHTKDIVARITLCRGQTMLLWFANTDAETTHYVNDDS